MRHSFKKGQSLVELALTMTLIFTLLSVAIDFGLAFFAYQGISGAAQEGANYAAMLPTQSRDLMRERAVNEAGLNVNTPHRARFVNLFDLNGDKTDDTVAVRTAMIDVSIGASELYPPGSANWDAYNISCQTRIDIGHCAMRMTVRYTYKPFFPAAGLLGFGDINISATRQKTISR